MDLEADQTVRNVNARLFELPRPVDVGLLVEAGLELDEHRDLLSLFGGRDERVDDGAVARRAVDGDLDRQHLRIVGRLLDELDHRRRERV